MLKKVGFACFITHVAFILFAQELPKVAVLDASLGQGVDPNASAIVADTVNEHFVHSGQYRVTDRANISRLQEEKRFQLSGEVSDDDIIAIGETLGAHFICVPHVSILGTTYTVSARLIDVETAQVIDQQSRRAKGDVDILIDLADQVGAAFSGVELARSLSPADTFPEPEQEEDAGDALLPEVETIQEEEPESAPLTETTRPVVTSPRPEQDTPVLTGSPRRPSAWEPHPAKSHLTFSYLFPSFGGMDNFYMNTNLNYYAIWEIDQALLDEGYDDAYNDDWGFDVHYMETFMEYGYFAMGLTFAQSSLIYEWGDSVYQQSNFMTFEPYLGMGGILAPVSFLDLYGGLNLGFMIFSLGTGYEQDATADFWADDGEVAFGVTFGLEIGADVYLGGLGLSLRYRFANAGDLTGDVIFTEGYSGDDNDISHGGFMVGGGIYF